MGIQYKVHTPCISCLWNKYGCLHGKIKKLIYGAMDNGMVVLTACLILAQGLEVSKRRLDQFAEMIRLATGHDASGYNNYGNWCGVGGKGEPVDEVDKCCKTHDLCYNKLVTTNICKNFETYIDKYEVTKANNTIKCTNKGTNSTAQISCRDALCKCDTTAVKCFKIHTKDWNIKNKKWSMLDSLIKFFTRRYDHND